MTELPAILGTGLVSSVGFSAAASCAAIRAKIANPTETRFIDGDGSWIMAHRVLLKSMSSGRPKLVEMAVLAIEDCLKRIPRQAWRNIPMLLCVAEHDRPGRIQGIDQLLLPEIQERLGVEFSSKSGLIPHGRTSIGTAVMAARKFWDGSGITPVVVVAVDSLVNWSTLSVYHGADRLLTPSNSNGFIAGEGAAALLLGAAVDDQCVVCAGIGFASESAHVESEKPLRGDGMSMAIRAALDEAECDIHDVELRINDCCGEQYYFKESALGFGKLIRKRVEIVDIWHPAECIGNCGAVIGVAALVLAETASRRPNGLARCVLAEFGNDAGERSAIVLKVKV